MFWNDILKRPMKCILLYLLYYVAHEYCSFSMCWALVASNVLGRLMFGKESLIEIAKWMGIPGRVGCGRGIAKQ